MVDVQAPWDNPERGRQRAINPQDLCERNRSYLFPYWGKPALGILDASLAVYLTDNDPERGGDHSQTYVRLGRRRGHRGGPTLDAAADSAEGSHSGSGKLFPNPPAGADARARPL